MGKTKKPPCNSINIMWLNTSICYSKNLHMVNGKKKTGHVFCLQQKSIFQAPKNAELLELSFHLALRRCCDVSVGVLTAMASRHVVTGGVGVGIGGKISMGFPTHSAWCFFLNIFYFYPDLIGK